MFQLIIHFSLLNIELEKTIKETLSLVQQVWWIIMLMLLLVNSKFVSTHNLKRALQTDIWKLEQFQVFQQEAILIIARVLLLKHMQWVLKHILQTLQLLTMAVCHMMKANIISHTKKHIMTLVLMAKDMKMFQIKTKTQSKL